MYTYLHICIYHRCIDRMQIASLLHIYGSTVRVGTNTICSPAPTPFQKQGCRLSTTAIATNTTTTATERITQQPSRNHWNHHKHLGTIIAITSGVHIFISQCIYKFLACTTYAVHCITHTHTCLPPTRPFLVHEPTHPHTPIHTCMNTHTLSLSFSLSHTHTHTHTHTHIHSCR